MVAPCKRTGRPHAHYSARAANGGKSEENSDPRLFPAALMLLASRGGNLSEPVSVERLDNADKDGDSRGRLSPASVRRHFLL
ncbi:hypothetical protein EYF80_020481 [Liparis tanakae]|uniref:Uncharacterized protein n=1 Tax=Liparis tanakae TaxID=230148 RepID=A0A4Z2HUM0_9TELE|nr:hypothetical protein EYF80_020481 [Liparis tanakae]